jgi:hypothetical protein
MLNFLDGISYPTLIIFALIMLVLPYPSQPMPHVVEKLIMLRDGELKRFIDIFDLFFHTAPTLVLIVKFVKDFFFSS